MSQRKSSAVSRRSFLQEASVLSGGTLLAAGTSAVHAQSADAAALPRRTLGRTGEQVSVLALGTAPCGQSRSVDTATVSRIVHEALELGINLVDSARIYGNAEEGIGRALQSRRDDVLLTTKVWADDARGARESLESSLRALRTDFVDLVYLHSVGNRDPRRVREPNGALTYLLREKEAGKLRFVGISGHSRVQRFVPLLESRDIDVVMMAMNFVDRYVYGFEETVLPVAVRHNVGVACMKVFGGIRGGFGNYQRPNPGPQLDPNYLAQAIRYALGLPGVATLVIGPHSVKQLRENVRMVKAYRPLDEDEREALSQIGRRWADQWGPHYGPVA